MQIEVAILPQTVTRLQPRVVLVIDVIRATTSIVTLFERGARAITLASDVEDARHRGTRNPRPDEFAEAFAATAVGQGLARLGLAHDTMFCAEINRTHCVPQLERGERVPDDIRMIWVGEAGA